LENQLLASQFNRKTEAHRLLPDLSVEYFKGSNTQLNGTLEGYSLGVKIPLFFNGQASRIRVARLEEEAVAASNENLTRQLKIDRDRLEAELRHQDQSLAYYEEEGNNLADAILKAAELGFRGGEIDFFQYIQSLENSYDIRLAYLNQLEQYNQTALNINFIAL
jgi:cobalt-zinc-cadmium resistance protein CzcA